MCRRQKRSAHGTQRTSLLRAVVVILQVRALQSVQGELRGVARNVADIYLQERTSSQAHHRVLPL